MKKIIIINFLILIFILSTIIIGSAIIIDGYFFYRSNFSNNKSLENFPNYLGDNKWVSKHFYEIKKMKTNYYDYIMWRRNDFSGETINISNGYRLNKAHEEFTFKKNIWVFGGSTVWGTGSRDFETIPSFLESLSNKKVINMGEAGYTTTQELNLLIKNLTFFKPKYIIFYDGFNDVYFKCREENNFYSSARENKIKRKINNSELLNLLEPTFRGITFIQKILNKKFRQLSFDCHKNLEKSNKIAQVFVDNWMLAKKISENYKIKFIPILQPNAFTTKSNLKHLKLDKSLELQVKTLYPLIKNELEKRKIEYVNFEKLLDEKKYFFIDFVHASPNANKKIANEIIKYLR